MYGIAGGVCLALYGVIATFQSFPSFGRVYAAYEGIFILLSLLWGDGGSTKKRQICMIGLVGLYV
ncbi:hypothetical protein LH47_01042 [Anoxybacillus thermarum]|uniref:Uncharacterized protein n=1 Tax=Anoxybacillus thermarum TaxID=404937 RepID=A0A0D0RTC2_9BACL|nr:hypothetical protein LH47_01042 [Anoxybacillus thermarum]